MVRKKSNKIGLVVHMDEFNSYEYLVNVLQTALGQHVTQAQNCANMIFKNGNYLVSTYHVNHYERARAIYDVFTKYEVPVELVPM